jgi:hypothetical protein
VLYLIPGSSLSAVFKRALFSNMGCEGFGVISYGRPCTSPVPVYAILPATHYAVRGETLVVFFFLLAFELAKSSVRSKSVFLTR